MKSTVLLQIPPALNWLEKDEHGRQWLRDLPARVARCMEKWGLRLEPPYQQSFVSIVFPAMLRDGSPAVLKIQWPHCESEHEEEALRRWNGNGAIHLFDFDPQEHALLLERCEPGNHLSTVRAEQALEVFIHLLPQLWVPAAAPFQTWPRSALNGGNDCRYLGNLRDVLLRSICSMPRLRL